MELWVRSQDSYVYKKRHLVKAYDISVKCSGNRWFILNGNDELGEYDTEERAFQILDEIENEIKKASRDYIIWGADERHMLEETDLIEINRQLQKYGVVNVPKEVKAEFVPKGSQVVIYQMPEK